MDLQLNLLQNEMEHLNRNLGLLSEQLVIMKEFVQLEFGDRFKEFCESRRRGPGPATAVSRPRPSGRQGQVEEMVRMSRSQSQRSSAPAASTSCVIKADLDLGQSEDEEMQDGMNPETDNENDVLLSGSEESDSDSDSDEPRRGSKPRSRIHRYFESIPQEDGKVLRRCLNCGKTVSNQAQRLKRHYQKCTAMPADVDLVAVGPRLATNQGQASKGRRPDRIRSFFRAVPSSVGYKGIKMECLRCKTLVSNRSGRLRSHISACKGDRNKADVATKGQGQSHCSTENVEVDPLRNDCINVVNTSANNNDDDFS